MKEFKKIVNTETKIDVSSTKRSSTLFSAGYTSTSISTANTHRTRLVSGFTLIELLIVIAIIGILAAILLPNLMSARAKAQDARRISEIRAIQTEAELYYDNNGQSYVDVCGIAVVNAYNVKISQLIQNQVDGGTLATCHSDADAYGAQVLLSTSSDSQWYCVDSTGFAGKGPVNFDTFSDLAC